MRTSHVCLVAVLLFLCVDDTLAKPARMRTKTPTQKASARHALASFVTQKTKEFLNGMGHSAPSHHRSRHVTPTRAHRLQLEEEGDGDEKKKKKDELDVKPNEDEFTDDEQEIKELIRKGHATEEDPALTKARKKRATRKMIIFLVVTIIVILIFGVVAFVLSKKNNPGLSAMEFLGLKGFDPLAVLVGMSSGLVFGIVDNGGLFFGMKYMEPLFEGLPRNEEPAMNAGYGNTFSDAVGAFLGTFLGRIIEEVSGVTSYPIWTEAVGIVIGCIIGVVVPRMFVDPEAEEIADLKKDAVEEGVDAAELARYLRIFHELDGEGSNKERKGQVQIASLRADGRFRKIIGFLEAADANNDGWIDEKEIIVAMRILNRGRKSSQSVVVQEEDNNNEAARDDNNDDNDNEDDNGDDAKR